MENHLKNKTTIIAGVIILGAFWYSYSLVSVKKQNLGSSAYAVRFAELSKNGNSACSSAFKDSIASMTDNARIQGSCCSPMNLHRYIEQVEGLKKYKDIKEIPLDPYDIEAGLAKKLQSYYDMELMLDEQMAYDYAMTNSMEKGPCCCKCWRWYVYGGLGKYLIKNYKFTGEQITEVWNLSDGCGGDNDHLHS
ncbi:MAG: hypothetical protein HYW77_00475 [Parcubacteria group bacterium]|nr:hypothetical protein [Parcubacteria group bacterium]